MTNLDNVLFDHERFELALNSLRDQLAKERNKAIQDCIEILINDTEIHFNGSDWLEKMEALKNHE